MEGWKFVDYTSLSPIVALSLTTDRWGLDPLPSNLRATNETIDDLIRRNRENIISWELTKGCQLPPNAWKYPGNIDTRKSFLPLTAPFCAEANSCKNTRGCITLIEGIGKTTFGPRNTDIVQFTHGISFVIVVISTLIMGWFKRGREMIELKFPPKAEGIGDDDFKQLYNPPPPPQNATAPTTIIAPPDDEKAKQIAHCAGLLRQMYSLDIAVWTMDSKTMSEDARNRQSQKREKANALHREIWRIVFSWKATEPGYFTQVEMVYVDEICKAMENYKRYPDAIR